jgi:hypothetical protein
MADGNAASGTPAGKNPEFGLIHRIAPTETGEPQGRILERCSAALAENDETNPAPFRHSAQMRNCLVPRRWCSERQPVGTSRRNCFRQAGVVRHDLPLVEHANRRKELAVGPGRHPIDVEAPALCSEGIFEMVQRSAAGNHHLTTKVVRRGKKAIGITEQ